MLRLSVTRSTWRCISCKILRMRVELSIGVSCGTSDTVHNTQSVLTCQEVRKERQERCSTTAPSTASPKGLLRQQLQGSE